ncbi:MAG: CapA family protein [Vallitalea sp.]|jgi:poly-gamma-glutamate synthesis protein (capsule biosynthesis protein)|nr:CapA family protein [Vallitalea sp.]
MIKNGLCIRGGKKHYRFILIIIVLLLSGCNNEVANNSATISKYNESKENNIDAIYDTKETESIAQVIENDDNNYSNTIVIDKQSVNDNNIDDDEGNEPNITSIIINAAGDCTLGTDEVLNQYSYKTFMEEYEDQKQSKTYFFQKVLPIFDKDDLTVVNLETTLTTAEKKANKKYRFKGYPEFNQILVEGSIEAVNLANNHIYDYLKQGYEETMKYLDEVGVSYFGNENYCIKDIKGIKIGLLGYEGFNYSTKVKERIKKQITYLKDEGCKLIIVSFHWGQEYSFLPNNTQKKLGHYVIDEGADLVLGHHPHVMQGIEKYNDKYIVYSLGNFCFGGNLNPKDKDTFIFQQTFDFDNNSEIIYNNIEIIPCSISSSEDRNDFQPVPLDEDNYDRIIRRINDYSKNLNFNYEN